MKNKKGFTLIELLAVIVILAIIALIATPIILNMINDARKNSAKSSALGYIDAIEYNNGFAQLGTTDINGTYEEIKTGDVTTANQKLGSHLKGKAPTSGTVTIDTKGKVTAADFCINGYNVTYDGKDATVNGKCNGSNNNNNNNNNEPEPVSYKCKKATTLTSIGSLTFGTNTGSTLVPGMALDCKVTTTGDYDHRFYYVTDLEGNTDYAVLIYNSNTKVVNGTLSNDSTEGFAYYDSANENWHGPVTAIEQLPTTTHWNNISLSSNTRAIKASDYGTTTGSGSKTLPTAFPYTGKAARILTKKEVEAACGTSSSSYGYLNNCTYFMENTARTGSTTKGYWLETPQYTSTTMTYGIASEVNYSRYIGYNNSDLSGYWGVRPAIEVLKSEIDLS